jgi:glycosyltransferase involved in cell wall biosynthesis
MSRKLAVAVIHYHLRPGGVTRVIERAVESLNDRVDLLVLTGEAPAAGSPLTPLTEPYPALEYCEEKPEKLQQLADDLFFSASSLMGREPDIWHIHNHSLGKNSFTPMFVKYLAEKGCRVLLQPHDFAEDGRADNYKLLRDQLGKDLEQTLYPSAEHVWYAPINFRDIKFLEKAGTSNVHILPNSVTPQSPVHSASALVNKTIVYPARAIRRKNMGEFLLWSLLAPEGYTFQSTLAPQNPKWQGYYNEWVAFAKELNLPVEFDAGRTHDFGELVQHADALITTSIQEGFGLAFLEPWLAGKNLLGRNLPEITSDFAEEGLDLSSLYDALPVPLAWAGETDFCETLEKVMRETYEAYDRSVTTELIKEAEASLVNDGVVDFGILDENLQRNVIRHLAGHPEARNQLPQLFSEFSESIIESNQKVVETKYSPEAYGDRLMQLYTGLAAVEPGPVDYASPSALLDQYLQPARFNLLRT